MFVGYQFCQDEKNLEDLKEFTTKGVSDLLDYSKEWEFGKLKLESFKDKYSKQNADEEEDNSEQATNAEEEDE